MASQVLGNAFYHQDCEQLARGLLGQTLVRVLDGERLSGRIVEVECYLGNNDLASHSCNGKRTPRNEPMYMKAGTAYVYSIYGMYFCFNISSKEAGSCVLLRALEPLEGQDQMLDLRMAARKPNSSTVKGRKTSPKKLKTTDLCNGPSKLCTALAIDKVRCNKLDMASSSILFMEGSESVAPDKIVSCKRIGIDSCGSQQWADMPLRFYELGSNCVSVRNKLAEQNLLSSLENG